jgi:hypothetical protein
MFFIHNHTHCSSTTQTNWLINMLISAEGGRGVSELVVDKHEAPARARYKPKKIPSVLCRIPVRRCFVSKLGIHMPPASLVLCKISHDAKSTRAVCGAGRASNRFSSAAVGDGRRTGDERKNTKAA